MEQIEDNETTLSAAQGQLSVLKVRRHHEEPTIASRLEEINACEKEICKLNETQAILHHSIHELKQRAASLKDQITSMNIQINDGKKEIREANVHRVIDTQGFLSEVSCNCL